MLSAALMAVGGHAREWPAAEWHFTITRITHSCIHEVLGVARGHAQVRFCGAKGRALKLKAGDVVILSAGTGHERLSGSKDLLVIGAYPHFGTYDECGISGKEHDPARTTIPKVALPPKRSGSVLAPALMRFPNDLGKRPADVAAF